jgi:uncharacterized protein
MAVKIGVLSDTHIPNRARALPPELFEIFQDVHLILHAGDLVQEEVLLDLMSIAPVEAVAGNMDPPHLEERLKARKLLEVGGLRLGLTHGHGARGQTMERAYQTFALDKPHCIVFGHSHQPCRRLHEGVLMFNPGSPTDKRREKYPSCGLLTIAEGKISGEIIFLKKKAAFFTFGR